MHPNRSYFFVHYGGAIQIMEQDPSRDSVLVQRKIPGSDSGESFRYETLNFVRHSLAAQGRTRYYFYADTRLTVDQAIDVLLSPPHREPADHEDGYQETISGQADTWRT